MNFDEGRLVIEFIIPRLEVHRADVGAKYHGEKLFKKKIKTIKKQEKSFVNIPPKV